MKFLVDAQLPYGLKVWLLAKGFDAIHTIDLSAQNLSSDMDIVQVADAEDRIVISKDSDFLKLHVLRKKPARLLMITVSLRQNGVGTGFSRADAILPKGHG